MIHKSLSLVNYNLEASAAGTSVLVLLLLIALTKHILYLLRKAERSFFMEIKKIEDTSMNLEVKGQGCWNDCYVGGYWSGKKSTSTNGCSYYDVPNSAQTNFWS